MSSPTVFSLSPLPHKCSVHSTGRCARKQRGNMNSSATQLPPPPLPPQLTTIPTVAKHAIYRSVAFALGCSSTIITLLLLLSLAFETPRRTLLSYYSSLFYFDLTHPSFDANAINSINTMDIWPPLGIVRFAVAGLADQTYPTDLSMQNCPSQMGVGSRVWVTNTTGGPFTADGCSAYNAFFNINMTYVCNSTKYSPAFNSDPTSVCHFVVRNSFFYRSQFTFGFGLSMNIASLKLVQPRIAITITNTTFYTPTDFGPWLAGTTPVNVVALHLWLRATILVIRDPFVANADYTPPASLALNVSGNTFVTRYDRPTGSSAGASEAATSGAIVFSMRHRMNNEPPSLTNAIITIANNSFDITATQDRGQVGAVVFSGLRSIGNTIAIVDNNFRLSATASFSSSWGATYVGFVVVYHVTAALTIVFQGTSLSILRNAGAIVSTVPNFPTANTWIRSVTSVVLFSTYAASSGDPNIISISDNNAGVETMTESYLVTQNMNSLGAFYAGTIVGAMWYVMDFRLGAVNPAATTTLNVSRNVLCTVATFYAGNQSQSAAGLVLLGGGPVSLRQTTLLIEDNYWSHRALHPRNYSHHGDLSASFSTPGVHMALVGMSSLGTFADSYIAIRRNVVPLCNLTVDTGVAGPKSEDSIYAISMGVFVVEKESATGASWTASDTFVEDNTFVGSFIVTESSRVTPFDLYFMMVCMSVGEAVSGNRLSSGGVVYVRNNSFAIEARHQTFNLLNPPSKELLFTALSAPGVPIISVEGNSLSLAVVSHEATSYINYEPYFAVVWFATTVYINPRVLTVSGNVMKSRAVFNYASPVVRYLAVSIVRVSTSVSMSSAAGFTFTVSANTIETEANITGSRFSIIDGNAEWRRRTQMAAYLAVLGLANANVTIGCEVPSGWVSAQISGALPFPALGSGSSSSPSCGNVISFTGATSVMYRGISSIGVPVAYIAGVNSSFAVIGNTVRIATNASSEEPIFFNYAATAMAVGTNIIVAFNTFQYFPNYQLRYWGSGFKRFESSTAYQGRLPIPLVNFTGAFVIASAMPGPLNIVITDNMYYFGSQCLFGSILPHGSAADPNNAVPKSQRRNITFAGIGLPVTVTTTSSLFQSGTRYEYTRNKITIWSDSVDKLPTSRTPKSDWRAFHGDDSSASLSPQSPTSTDPGTFHAIRYDFFTTDASGGSPQASFTVCSNNITGQAIAVRDGTAASAVELVGLDNGAGMISNVAHYVTLPSTEGSMEDLIGYITLNRTCPTALPPLDTKEVTPSATIGEGNTPFTTRSLSSPHSASVSPAGSSSSSLTLTLRLETESHADSASSTTTLSTPATQTVIQTETEQRTNSLTDTAATVSNSFPSFPDSNNTDNNKKKRVRGTETLSRSISIPLIGLLVPIKPPSQEANEATQQAVGIVNSAVGIVSASSGGALGVANAMGRLVSCDDDADDELPIMTHPLRFSFGPSGGDGEENADSVTAIVSAAVVSNCIIIPIVIVGGARLPIMYVVRRYMSRRGTSEEEVLAALGWPSLIVLPFVPLGEGIGVVITRALRYGQPMGIGVGLIGLIIVLFVIVTWVYTLFTRVPRQNIVQRKTFFSGFAWWINPLYEWEARPVIAAPSMALYHNSGSKRGSIIPSLSRRNSVSVSRSTSRTAIGNSPANSGVHFVGGASASSPLRSSLTTTATVAVPSSPLSPMIDTVPIMQYEAGEVEVRPIHGVVQARGRAGGGACADDDDLAMELLSTASHDTITPSEAVAATAPSREAFHRTEVDLLRSAHMLGEKRFYYAEFVSFMCSLIVGVAEGMPGSTCKERVLLAFFAAIVQAASNATAIVPLELLLQTLLGLCVAALAFIAVTQVFGDVDASTGDMMDVFNAVGNVLGLAATIFGMVRAGFDAYSTNNRRMRARRVMEAQSAGDAVALAMMAEQLRDAGGDIDDARLGGNKGSNSRGVSTILLVDDNQYAIDGALSADAIELSETRFRNNRSSRSSSMTLPLTPVGVSRGAVPTALASAPRQTSIKIAIAEDLGDADSDEDLEAYMNQQQRSSSYNNNTNTPPVARKPARKRSNAIQRRGGGSAYDDDDVLGLDSLLTAAGGGKAARRKGAIPLYGVADEDESSDDDFLGLLPTSKLKTRLRGATMAGGKLLSTPPPAQTPGILTPSDNGLIPSASSAVGGTPSKASAYASILDSFAEEDALLGGAKSSHRAMRAGRGSSNSTPPPASEAAAARHVLFNSGQQLNSSTPVRGERSSAVIRLGARNGVEGEGSAAGPSDANAHRRGFNGEADAEERARMKALTSVLGEEWESSPRFGL